MKVEVITVGDEIISGTITDTNFAWLGDSLWSRGFELHWHTSVGDDADEISRALLAAVGRSQTVVVTGGLGPTMDDMTVDVAAKTFGLPLVLNGGVLQSIKARFKKIGREMTPNNEKQAFFPEGARILPNTYGTAPGCYVVYQKTHFFFLPGVPREMKQQFKEAVLPVLEGLAGEKIHFYQKVLRGFGAPEATIGQRLEGINLQGADLAYRISFPEILLKISARGGNYTEIERSVDQIVQEIRNRLGDIIYGEGDEGLASVVGRLLKKKKATLAVAESCTGGRLASLITDCAGSSEYFDRGVVTYSNQSKMDILHVPSHLFETFGAVSAETAAAMAKGVRKISQTTYSLAVTGIAGPGGATLDKPVGTVHIALDSDEGTTTREFHFPTHREWFKLIASFEALDLLRKKIL